MIMFVFTFVAVFTSSRPDTRVIENNPPRSLVEDHLDHLESHPMAHYIRNAENWNVLFIKVEADDGHVHRGSVVLVAEKAELCL